MLLFVFLFASSVGLAMGDTPTISRIQCAAPKTSKIKFSYIGYQNQSGQWISQVGLHHDGSELSSNKSLPWSLDVEQTSVVTCEGDTTVNILASMAGPSPLPVKKVIPLGYLLFPDIGYYKIHPQGTVWSSARQICADEGAHLVIINSETEANVMKELFTKTPKSSMSGDRKDGVWVGIVEPKGTKTYFTIFGDPLSSTGFSRWSPGDPNDSGRDACIFLYEGNLGLADINPCSTQLAYVCEIEL